MMKQSRFALIGAGNGGQSMAAHLSLLGHYASLYDVDRDKIRALRQLGSIKVSGAIDGQARPALITDSIEAAIKDVDVIMVVVPTCFHASVASELAPYLVDDQVVVLNPGATGGALEFRHILNQNGCQARVVIGETQTLLYACRSPKPGETVVFGVKDRVEVATLPSIAAPQVAALINTAFPQFRPVPNVWYTSLSNVNAMCHPTPTLLNAGRIESKADFEYYFDGITPSIARVVEAMDAQRVAIGAALGITLTSLRDWFEYSYGAQGNNLYEIIQANKAYAGIKGPTTLNTRYLFEDLPTGLVPLALLGDALGVDTSLMKAVVELGNTLLGHNYWREGRTLEKLGLAKKSKGEILALAR